MREITTKKAFREWLMSLPPDKKRFKPIESCLCPLAQYAQASVGSDTYTYIVSGRRFYLPVWAREFVARFDCECILYVSYTAAVALQILDKTVTP